MRIVRHTKKKGPLQRASQICLKLAKVSDPDTRELEGERSSISGKLGVPINPPLLGDSDCIPVLISPKGMVEVYRVATRDNGRYFEVRLNGSHFWQFAAVGEAWNFAAKLGSGAIAGGYDG